MTTYTTRSEAVLREVIEPIEATGEASRDEYDIEAIADEVLEYDPAFGHIQDAGYSLKFDVDDFWDVVRRHEREE